MSAQIRHAGDVRPSRNQHDGRGTLEDGRQHDQPAAQRPVTQNAGGADPKIRFAAANRFRDIDTGAALADGDVKTCIAIEALLKRRVVASELTTPDPARRQDATPAAPAKRP